MPKIYIAKAFKLQHQDKDGKPTVTHFDVGNHTVPADVAEHWFVKAHTGEEPAAGTDDDADLAEKRSALDSAAEFLEGKAKELKGLQDALDARTIALTEGEAKLAGRVSAADQRAAELDQREAALAAREQALATAEKAAAEAAAKTVKK